MLPRPRVGRQEATHRKLEVIFSFFLLWKLAQSLIVYLRAVHEEVLIYYIVVDLNLQQPPVVFEVQVIPEEGCHTKRIHPHDETTQCRTASDKRYRPTLLLNAIDPYLDLNIPIPESGHRQYESLEVLPYSRVPHIEWRELPSAI